MLLQKKTALVLGYTSRRVTLEIRGICIVLISMAEAIAGTYFWTPHSTKDVYI